MSNVLKSSEMPKPQVINYGQLYHISDLFPIFLEKFSIISKLLSLTNS